MRGSAYGMIISFSLLICVMTGALLYTTVSIINNNHKWCTVLNTLAVQKPIVIIEGNTLPPGILRELVTLEHTYNGLTVKYAGLRHQFGCDKR